ncbi:GNAT family N-acetyltransferase [Albimonas sp. CAU 1670]|uniref:GNAT family N-acetyltransferase n=1 Tax=Albimonas sp. CAU 1670 TaxID=3032599 RepID=UPI0023DA56C3|nr:GNAT family N-acetyltransferase [Albimonas sp. CAU 1670]MDF2234012.1 GNAT family N-acetyltransferase [Albimonas sp. CAU 1670]
MNTLRTQRLEGRPIRPRDASFAAALFGREEVGRWTGEGDPWTRAVAAQRARAFAAHWTAHGFGLRLWRDARGPAGVAGLQFCVLEGAAAIEASFAFAPERWGEGLATEAMRASLAEAQAICAEVQAVVREGNAPAVAVLRRLGFVERASTLRGLRRFARPTAGAGLAPPRSAAGGRGA